MADLFSREKRSEIMSRVKGLGNERTEIALVRLFRRHKIRGWRRRYSLFGKPDFVFPATRVAIFVDGCFWHSCKKHGSIPASNREFWRAKLERNQARDRVVNRTLRRCGWIVIRVWQHELTRLADAACITRIQRTLARREQPRIQARRNTRWEGRRTRA
jgi:DNA mismatch endonuclease (patch repair protein)